MDRNIVVNSVQRFSYNAYRCVVAVALFHENDEPVNQLAYSVSAKTINILNTVLPDNKIVQKSEYVINDMYNVSCVGKNDNLYTKQIE